MTPLKKILFITSISLVSLVSMASDNQAKPLPAEKGVILYNQLKISAAIPYLKSASEAGDQEAQYYLAESLRKRNRHMTSEAHRWYEAAAKQGNYYAMIQLGRSGDDLCKNMNNCPSPTTAPVDWLRTARDLAQPRAEHGDAEAMYVMYEITLDRSWLKKSALAGNSTAQYWMAIGDKQGEGFFLPGGRNASVGNWLKASAEGGNPRAMMEYAAYLHENSGDLEIARHWIRTAAERGYERGVTSYGAYLAHAPERFGFEFDVVKGYAITSLLKELDEGGGMQSYVDEVLPEIAQKMTPAQLVNAEKFASEWKASHPPLSFFPEKLGR